MKLTSVDVQTDSGYLNSDRQEAQAERTEAELPVSKTAPKAEVALPMQSESGISKEATAASSSFVPNYVGKGDEMKLTASFSPLQISSQPSLAPSQPAPQPSQPAPPSSQPAPAPTSPPAAEPYDPGVNETFIPNVERWRNDVVAAIAAYGGPANEVDLFLTIMHRESRGQPDATNPTSGAAGLMQHMPQYWDQRAISAGYAGASPYDPIANINVSAWLLYQAAGGGWGHWSTY
tara:strand:+ start:1380 stop:2081 length:702 start_codon:yes stop_codon:yes gene_type:complete